jgi:hypothetical protein
MRERADADERPEQNVSKDGRPCGPEPTQKRGGGRQFFGRHYIGHGSARGAKEAVLSHTCHVGAIAGPRQNCMRAPQKGKGRVAATF